MTLTRSRTIQYIGILLVLAAIAAGYWYFAVRAGVKTNTSGGQPQGTGDLSAGLVGYWKLDENTGTSAADASGNAITALTLTNGPTWTTGQIGSGITFDGTDDYATTADNSLLDFGDTDDMTITGWFNRSTFSTVDTIIAKRNGNAAADVGYMVSIDDTPDRLTFEVSDGTDEYSLTSVTAFTTAGWHHFAIVLNQDSAAVYEELYIDGIRETPTEVGTLSNVGDLSNALAFRIGAESDNGNPFAGSLDEIRVYDHRLEADEIAKLYRLTAPTTVDTGLVGYWAFGADDIRGTLVGDRSGRRNTGTLVNTPTKLSGPVGQAFDFNGTSQYIDAGSGTGLDNLTNVTLCAWARPDAAHTGWDNIVVKGAGWELGVENFVPKFFSNRTGSDGDWSALTVIPAGSWSHLCATYNGSSTANDPTLYVNGVAAAPTEIQTPAGSLVTDGGESAFIGAYDDTTSSPVEYFDGAIDEVRVYNRIIAAGEAKALYDAGSPNKTNTSAAQPEGTGNPDSGLVGYWKLDEGTGTSAADASVNATAAGTLTNGPTWGTGRIGSAVVFDGTDDYIALSDPASGVLDFGDTDDMTIAGWFNRSTFTTTDAIVSKWDGVNPGYRVYIDSSGDVLHFQLFDGTDTYVMDANGYAITAAGWHHFVAVWDQDSPANSEIYVDGVTLSATDTGTIGNIGTLATTVALSIGDTPGSGLQFAGSLDEIRIYDRAYSAEEVNILYNQTAATGVDTSLRGYWSFNAPDTPGTTAYDRSGARNTGTLTGGPTKRIGRVGQALDFDGTNDYVNVGSAASIDNLTNLSLCAWVNPDNIDTTPFNYSSVISQVDNGGAEADLTLYDDGVNDYINFYRSFSTFAGDWRSPPDILPIGSWSHICVTYNNSSVANDPAMYLNGVAIPVSEFQTPVGTASSTAGGDYLIGAWDDGGSGSDWYDGRIDEARIYSRLLSAAEIKALYDVSAPDKTNTSASTPQGTGNPDSSLVGYWKLDETTGSSAADTSTNSFTATLTNMENGDWTASQINNGLSFDGTNEYVALPSSTKLKPSRFTSAQWVYSNALPSGNTELIFAPDYSDGGWDTGWGVYEEMDGTIHVRWGDGTNPSAGSMGTDWSIVGAWHHVSVTFDGTTMRLYVDGTLNESANASTLAYGGASVAPNIGGGGNLGMDGFNGRLDEVRLYDRALADEEIANLFRQTTPTAVDTGLRGYWSFNGTDVSGTTAYDRSGAGNDATLTNGPTKTIGKLGQAVRFDGTNDYATAGDINALDGLTALTASAWVKTASLSVELHILDKAGCSGTLNGGVFELFGGLTATDKPEFAIYKNGGSPNTYNVASNTPITDGAWHLVTGTYDGANVKIYVDGVLSGTTAASSVTMPSTSYDLEIGGCQAGAYPWNGSIDEVRVYNRALSASEIQALYNSGR